VAGLDGDGALGPDAPGVVGTARAAPTRRIVAVHLDGVSFFVNRVAGLALVAYLYLHLLLLSMLVRGPDAWDDFVDLATSPPFLALDVLLLAGMLLHGLNGIRLALVGLGLVASRQKALLAGILVIAALLAFVGALRVLPGG
jgi:succinate dehydrogenase / fumarate reductase, cytochrome b subunit